MASAQQHTSVDILEQVLSVVQAIEDHFRCRCRGADKRRTHHAATASPAPAQPRDKSENCPQSRARPLPALRHTTSHSRCTPPHSCPLCHKEFAWLNSLKRHLRSHRGARMYRCKLCGYASTSRRGFIAHLRSHEQRPAYRCCICAAELPSKRRLLRHINAAHGYPPAAAAGQPSPRAALAKRPGRSDPRKGAQP